MQSRNNAHCVHILAEDVQRLVLDGVNKAHISLAIDESTDNTDISTLCVFVRYFNGKDFKEELLALIPLEGCTTGDIIFGKLQELFKKYGLSFEKVNLIVTDGAPTMLCKKKKGVWYAELRMLLPKRMHFTVLFTKVSCAPN